MSEVSCPLSPSYVALFKVEYHADAEYENRLKHSEKSIMFWSKATLTNNRKTIMSYHTSVF